MTKKEHVTAAFPDGTSLEFTLEVSGSPPWTIEYRGWDGQDRHIEAADIFEALRELRQEVEHAGGRLLCAGARPDVWPSRMSRSMGGGRKAYVMRLGQSAGTHDLVDIFNPVELEAVGTVEEQRAYVDAWLASLKQKR